MFLYETNRTDVLFKVGLSMPFTIMNCSEKLVEYLKINYLMAFLPLHEGAMGPLVIIAMYLLRFTCISKHS